VRRAVLFAVTLVVVTGLLTAEARWQYREHTVLDRDPEVALATPVTIGGTTFELVDSWSSGKALTKPTGELSEPKPPPAGAIYLVTHLRVTDPKVAADRLDNVNCLEQSAVTRDGKRWPAESYIAGRERATLCAGEDDYPLRSGVPHTLEWVFVIPKSYAGQVYAVQAEITEPGQVGRLRTFLLR
jgi:hypothetical protein